MAVQATAAFSTVPSVLLDHRPQTAQHQQPAFCLQVQSQGPNHAALADLEKANVLEEQAAGLRAAALSKLNPVTLATLGRVRSQVASTALNLQVSSSCF